MPITLRNDVNRAITYEEGDANLVYLDKKLIIATRDPVTTDDSSEGYTVHEHLWFNSSSNIFFKPINIALDAAVWEEVSFGGSGGGGLVAKDNGYVLAMYALQDRATIGNGTVDLSNSSSSSSGARANGTFMVGYNHIETTGNGYNAIFGYLNATQWTAGYCLVAGAYNRAYRDYSFVAGLGNNAYDTFNYLLGKNNSSDHPNAYLFGEQLVSGATYQTILGFYNLELDNTILQIGMGTSSARADVFQVLKNGLVTAPLSTVANITLGADTTLTTKDWVINNINNNISTGALLQGEPTVGTPIPIVSSSAKGGPSDMAYTAGTIIPRTTDLLVRVGGEINGYKGYIYIYDYSGVVKTVIDTYYSETTIADYRSLGSQLASSDDYIVASIYDDDQGGAGLAYYTGAGVATNYLTAIDGHSLQFFNVKSILSIKNDYIYFAINNVLYKQDLTNLSSFTKVTLANSTPSRLFVDEVITASDYSYTDILDLDLGTIGYIDYYDYLSYEDYTFSDFKLNGSTGALCLLEDDMEDGVFTVTTINLLNNTTIGIVELDCTDYEAAAMTVILTASHIVIFTQNTFDGNALIKYYLHDGTYVNEYTPPSVDYGSMYNRIAANNGHRLYFGFTMSEEYGTAAGGRSKGMFIELLGTPGVLARPTSAEVGQYYFDPDLNKPIWWNSTAWVDAVGTVV